MTNLVGQQFGNYRLIRLLGQGGFAEVYLGEHTRLGMNTAIKVLHTHLISDDIQTFQQEARMIAELKHPHIIRVFDFDVQEGVPFLVLDYASNGSLRQKHAKGKKLPLDLVVAYVRQVADALQYAHDRKIIHRDVKPENMLIGDHGEVLLSDFGIATIAHGTSSMNTQTSQGTLAYMAPEQIQGKPRPESDQYALAVVIYQWLCGELPFQGSSTEIIAQQLAASPPPLREKVPDLAVDVEQVVLTALRKDPKARFAHIQAFAQALAQASEAGEGQSQRTGAQAFFATKQHGITQATGVAGSPVSPPQHPQSSPVLLDSSPLASQPATQSQTVPRFRRRILVPMLVTVVLQACFPLLLLLYDSLQTQFSRIIPDVLFLLDDLAHGFPLPQGQDAVLMSILHPVISFLPLLATGVTAFFTCRAITRRGGSALSGLLVCLLADLCFLGTLILTCITIINLELRDYLLTLQRVDTIPPMSNMLKDLGISSSQAIAQSMQEAQQSLSHGLTIYMGITLVGLLLFSVSLGSLGNWRGKKYAQQFVTPAFQGSNAAQPQAHITQLADQEQLGALTHVYQAKSPGKTIITGIAMIVLAIAILFVGRFVVHIGGTGLFLTICVGIIGAISMIVLGVRHKEYRVYLHTNGLIAGSPGTVFKVARWEDITQISSQVPKRLYTRKKETIVLWRHLESIEALEQRVQHEVGRVKQI